MRIAKDLRRSGGLALSALMMLCALSARSHAEDKAALPRDWRPATLVQVTEQNQLIVVYPSARRETLAVADAELLAEARVMSLPRGVNLQFSTAGVERKLVALAASWTTAGRALALFGSLLLWLVIAGVLLGGQLWRLVVGADNRYSNSKLQMALWFVVVLTSYTAVVILRGMATRWRLIGGVDIPQNLLLLSGLSALTFAGAKAITQGKVDAAPAAAPVKQRVDHPRFPRDLFENDAGQVDIGDFQMLIVTLLAIVVYTALLINFLGALPMTAAVTLPDVDQTILAAFGLGQGAYLAKKFVSRPGEG